ncbi:MAG: tRNA pseudouridine(38-40) synthase TruA [Oscillospiraceae bacterium]
MKFVGTAYHGSQIQENALTVQEVFQNALKRVLGYLPDIKCCSRTDSGVHANAFCISFFSTKDMDTLKMCMALNMALPRDIAVVDCKLVPDDFHARYSALKKQYVYRVYNARVMDPFQYGRAAHIIAPLNEQKLDRAAKLFIGEHDFSSFCSIKCKKGNTVRTVYSFDVTRSKDEVLFCVEADGFLYNMVRIMVGALLNTESGKLSEQQLCEYLYGRQRDNLLFTAPAEGLYLNKVTYD